MRVLRNISAIFGDIEIKYTMDSYDRKILAALQRDARVSNQRLAESVGLSASPCLRRVQKLEKKGLIRDRVTLLDRKALGLHILAFVHVSLEDHLPQTLQKFDGVVSDCDQILECHALSGQYDYLLKVVARDMADFEQFLTHELLAGRGVASANTSFVINERKDSTVLPLD
ncbi:MAG: Lrp/AsnC family transcriptional regulator [Pseudomonadota bacterium]